MTTWAPAVGDVARLVPKRAVGSTGRLPTFTDATTPTAEQVEEIIAQAVGDVVAAAGSFDPDVVINEADVDRGEEPVSLGDLARAAAQIDAAALVELTFFADQVNSDRSSYEQLNARYGVALDRFVVAVGEHGAGGVVAGGKRQVPSFTFPAATDRSRLAF